MHQTDENTDGNSSLGCANLGLSTVTVQKKIATYIIKIKKEHKSFNLLKKIKLNYTNEESVNYSNSFNFSSITSINNYRFLYRWYRLKTLYRWIRKE